jgi:probable HAF family extracellular repeat protein
MATILWDGKVMTDLGTFGGSSGEATRVSDAGVVIGSASYPGDIIFRAFVWHDGILKDIGVVPGDKCAKAWGIKSKGQVVGASGDCNVPVHAFLWEKGHMIDLTRLMPPGVQLTYGIDINEFGHIAAYGRVPGNGDSGVLHAFLLVPIGDGAEPVNQTPEKQTSGLARIGGRVRGTDVRH